jgi:hypothetical protein
MVILQSTNPLVIICVKGNMYGMWISTYNDKAIPVPKNVP